jgi:serine/threonine-protein kinase
MSSMDTFPPAVGTTLDGRFVVQRVLGSGGMGVVLQAEHLGLRRRVAVKLLRPDFLRSPQVIHRFLREARAVATLKSEHVVDVLDAGLLWSKVPYFVMEHLSGIDLGTMVQRFGPRDVEDVIHYALQTLEALAEAHRLGVIHRDLKPTNLFLTTREDDSGFVKVLDFGVSKLVGWGVTADGIVTRHGTVLGSPRYMSPEQIQDSSNADARSDIWSFGAVLHELLAGVPPFDEPNIASVIRTICRRPYELPGRDDLPPELRTILLTCLRKDPKDRHQSVEELAQAFQPLVRSAATQVSIDRILRRGASAAPPQVDDGRASLPSFTPISIDTTHPARRKRGPWRAVRTAIVAAAGLFAAFSLGRLGSDQPRPLTSPAAPAPAMTTPVQHSVVARKAPAPVTVDVRPAPSATASTPAPRRTIAASKKRRPISEPEPLAVPAAPSTASTLAFGELPPPPVRKIRKLDTDNPFVR